jgi:hypothetical protein
MVQGEADKQPLPEAEWATDAALLAPGWEAAAKDEASGYQTQTC